MILFFENKTNALINTIVSLAGGVIVYSILAEILVPLRILVPLSIIISVLIFGLTRYYSNLGSSRNDGQDFQTGILNAIESTTSKNKIVRTNVVVTKVNSTTATIIFSIFYGIMIVVSAFSSPDLEIYLDWKDMSPINFIELCASIILTFFLPGYAIITNLSMNRKYNALLKIIIGYFFSIVITGLTTYFSVVTFDASVTQIKTALIAVNIAILTSHIISSYLINLRGTTIDDKSANHSGGRHNFLLLTKIKLSNIKTRISELLVFTSLFALLIVSTYYMYGGITIGDQWFHQGRSMLFLSSSFGQVAASGLDSYYIPFQSALIAGLTTLSGNPLVNTYASIAFLNIIPLFSFYYFYSRWAPQNMQRANILASSLFVICSGFGWIYLVSLTATSGTPISEQAAIETISNIRSYILMPSNFTIASHPDFSTALIYISIPAGLILLGFIRQLLESKFTFTLTVTIIAVLGILSHEEFYLFIIVASIIPPLFRIKQGHYLYLALLLSFSIIYLINVMSPLNYYSYTEIFGYPLLTLAFIFVPVMWIIYLVIQNHSKINRLIPKKVPKGKNISFESLRNLSKSTSKARYILPLIIVISTALLYVSSFAIVASVSPDTANEEALRGQVSWYQYPMKLGIAGLFALAFILSYLFKRFEKQIFVFGIIIVVSIITAQYYDEHRFSKYIMLGSIPLASIFLYRILDLRIKYKPIFNGIIIMVIVTTGSLSTLLFVGYNSLAFENHDSVHDLGRRNFPSESEFHLLQALKNSNAFSSDRYNVISTPNEYNFYKGTLLTKLSTFDGIPAGKLLQGRFILNVTTLDAFYRLLDYTDARYIIIPKDDIKNASRLTQPVRFALDSFPHYYEDSQYVVLEVPHLAPPSSTSSSGGETDVALVLKQKESQPTNYATYLEYKNDTFDLSQLMNSIRADNNSSDHQDKAQNIILCASERKTNHGTTVWSKDLNSRAGSKINYVDVGFQVISSYEKSGWSDAGLRWKEGDREYYASLSKNGLELYQISVPNDEKSKYEKKLLYQNTQIQKKDNLWYNLKVESLQDSINIYVDDILKIKLARLLLGDTINSTSISSIGVSCFNNPVEFSSIRVGMISELPVDNGGIKTNNFKDYDYYYYPMSILALSQNSYDTFLDTDLSALSKKVVMLSFDPLDWDNNRFDSYIEYVNHGGTLVVINSNSNFTGRFSQLLSIEGKNDNESKIAFTDITSIKNERIESNFSGTVNKIQIGSSNTSIMASYENYVPKNTKDNANQTVPFAVKKNYQNGGKIIIVNAAGYFDAISKSKTFTSLVKISDILGLQSKKKTGSLVTSLPPQQFVGVADTTGNVKMQSTSVLLDTGHNSYDDNDETNDYSNSNGYNLGAQRITIYEDKKPKYTFSNASIGDLELAGDYTVALNSFEGLEVPYLTSQHNYFGVLMPPGFNMTINMSSKPLTYAKIVMQNQSNQTSSNTITINGSTVIELNNIKAIFAHKYPDSVSSSTSIPILLKNPEIEVDGNSKFMMLRFSWHFLENIQYDIQGLKTRLKFIDDYSEPYGNGTKIKYITFMNSTTNI